MVVVGVSVGAGVGVFVLSILLFFNCYLKMSSHSKIALALHDSNFHTLPLKDLWVLMASPCVSQLCQDSDARVVGFKVNSGVQLTAANMLVGKTKHRNHWLSL